jgi:4-diphosphocytidyl-2-C-methyl-D-erythritol kinase
MAAEPAASMPARPLTTRCRAKINLTLRVLGRRPDGYHELESLVAFAGVGDGLTLEPGPEFGLTLAGSFGEGLAAEPDNLVLKAARALAEDLGPLRWGRFHLVKRLPLASGIGGGSADAAGALRLLASLNGIAEDDPVLARVAARIGADVPVCLASRARLMSGLGEVLGPPLILPPLFAVLVNPGLAVATVAVFKALGLEAGETHSSNTRPRPEKAASAAVSKDPPDVSGANGSILRDALPRSAPQDQGSGDRDTERAALLNALSASANDLEAPARRLAPVIGNVLARLAALPGCRLARMSGSGATCLALFDDCRQSAQAASALRREERRWWVKATVLR